MKNKAARLAVGAATAIVALSVMASTGARASTPRPVAYACGMGEAWSCPEVQPSELAFGAHWGFAGPGSINPWHVRPIHWTHWTVRSAFGSGQFFAGQGARLVTDYSANIALTDVQHHGWQPYFRDLTITARGHSTVHLWYGLGGGFVGWHQ
jgi:hypothetical protein